MTSRATSPVVGVVLMTFLSVVLAASVGATAMGLAAQDITEPRQARLTVAADPSTGRIALTHHGGDALPVDALRVRISIDDEPLAHQPPVPFFASTGFEAGPSGPFNVAHDGPWRAGETAALRLASTNSPALTPGATVEVDVYTEEQRIATLRTTASA